MPDGSACPWLGAGAAACVWPSRLAGADDCAYATTNVAQMMSRKTAARRGSSFRGCIVSGLRMDSECWQALGRIELNFHLPPFAIPSCIGWTVTEDILVAQLYSNLCGHIGKLVY